MSRHIAILTPVLDDWAAFAILLEEIVRHHRQRDLMFHVFAVDDGSVSSFESSELALPADSCVVELKIIRLALNLGHQRAIAAGLCTLVDRRDVDAVIVMDSDGEDRPEDISALLQASEQAPDAVILARRAQRSEGLLFRCFYLVYKMLFRILIGRTINFGNFALLPLHAVRRLVHMGELWNNLPATIMRSRIPYLSVPTARGQRYAGKSSMNLVGLAVHGLSAMSVYTDRIFVRVLIATTAIGLASLGGIFTALLVRFTTNLAIPGWTTTAVGDLIVILLQTVVILIATSLVMLAGRSSRPIVPIIDAWPFIAEQRLFPLSSGPQTTGSTRPSAVSS